jgi:hypothetical protein
MQLSKEETRAVGELVRGKRIRLLEATAVDDRSRTLEGYNEKFYGGNEGLVSYIGNSNGYAVAAVHFPSGASATVTMDRIAEIL